MADNVNFQAIPLPLDKKNLEKYTVIDPCLLCRKSCEEHDPKCQSSESRR